MMAKNVPDLAGDYILVGKIVKAHGLRGEVKILCYSGCPKNIQGYKELVLANDAGKFFANLTVLKSRVQEKMAVAQLASIDNRAQAEELRGLAVFVAKSYLPNIAKDEYYWHQYLGKLVKDIDGKTIGRVKTIFHNGAQDILVVKAGNEEALIPVTKSIVVKVTTAVLTVDPPQGLLELIDETGSGKKKAVAK